MSDAFQRFLSHPPIEDRPESLRYRQILATGQPASLTTRTRERTSRLFRRS